MEKITIRSDRDTDYIFQYKGEDVTLKARSILSIADGLNHVVLPTCAMKIANNLIIIKDDVKIWPVLGAMRQSQEHNLHCLRKPCKPRVVLLL